MVSTRPPVLVQVTLAALLVLAACARGGGSGRGGPPAVDLPPGAGGGAGGGDGAGATAGVGVDAAAGPGTDSASAGPIPPPPSRPAWRWGPLQKDDCGAPGLRQVSAPLRNIPGGVDPQQACQQAPRNVMGIDFARPDRCVPDGRAVRGQWDVPDSSCLATAPPAPTRGGDGQLALADPLEGFADLHLHQMSNLGFGGSVVWGAAYGPPMEALGPIPAAMKAGHDRTEALFDGQIAQGLIGLTTHEETGFPSFTGWPSRELATHQQAHEDWLYRAYQGGLRLMVMLAVNSEDMFGRGENDLPLIGNVPMQTVRAAGRTSNDMEALEWQVREAYRMMAHIDQKNGGPGQGWYRIVRDPEEASQVIAGGRLAVVLGTELQHLFNCDSDRPACTRPGIVEGLDRLEAMGVSYVFPIHHKLNQFGGPTQFNVLTNGPTEDCHETAEACSAVGLTDLGRFLIEELTARGMFIDTEHMSWKALDDTLALAESRRYPLMASHVGPFDLKADQGQNEQVRRTDQLRRILGTGGMLGIIYGVGVEEYAPSRAAGVRLPISCGGADRWANAYAYMKDLAGGGLAGAGGRVTIGSDWNGFASWPGPRFAAEPCAARTARDGKPLPKPAPISYPLPAPAGLLPAAVGGSPALAAVTSPRPLSYDKEGLMHVGLTPEFLEDLRLSGLTLADLEPIYRSARGVVDLWRTARDRQVPGDRHQLRWVPARPFDLLDFDVRDAARDVLADAGLPLCRTGRQGQGDVRLGIERQGVCAPVEGADGPPADPLRDQALPITSYHAGRCLDVDSESLRDGARVQQYSCAGGSHQRWRLRPVAGAATPLYELVVESSGKCLTIEGDGTAIGAGVVQQSCAGAPTQRWSAVRAGNTFSLRAATSGLCLEVSDQSRGNGAAIRQSSCSGAADQQWQIEALRGGDHQRLYQSSRGAAIWASGPSPRHPLPVAVGDDGGRLICRALTGAGGRLVGVVTGPECVGRAPDGSPAAASTFEQLFQSR